MSSDKSKKPFQETPMAGALVAGVFSLVAIILGFYLGNLSPIKDSFDVSVEATEYPFPDTNVWVNEGDEVEIMVLAADRTSWNCGLDVTNSLGVVNNEYQLATILPSGNHCSLIGRVGDGPYFVIGAYSTFIANMSGSLFLGANDAPSEKCGTLDCFQDNEGKQFVKITIVRNE